MRTATEVRAQVTATRHRSLSEEMSGLAPRGSVASSLPSGGAIGSGRVTRNGESWLCTLSHSESRQALSQATGPVRSRAVDALSVKTNLELHLPEGLAKVRAAGASADR